MLHTLLFLFSFALADEAGRQTCALQGIVSLSAPTGLFCLKDMKIADGTRVITNGYPLSITVIGTLFYGEPAGHGASRARGLTIQSFASPVPQSHAAGPISIYARVARGHLEIYNFGASEKDLSGEVSLEYFERTRDYTQKIAVAPSTRVDLTVGGHAVKSAPPLPAEAAPPMKPATADLGGESVSHPRKPKPHRKRISRPRQIHPPPPGEPAYPPPGGFFSFFD